ncbi:MAG: hypothetical protein AB7R89_29630 [Dehalococcoidia bacterium]
MTLFKGANPLPYPSWDEMRRDPAAVAIRAMLDERGRRQWLDLWYPGADDVLSRKAARVRALIARGALVEALKIVEKPSKLVIIARWWDFDQINAGTLNRCLAEEWNMVEAPSIEGTRRLVRLFRAADFVTDTPGTERPVEPITIYRGAGLRSKRGLSWTTDRDTAVWFATRWDAADRYVFTTTIAPRHVLGIFHDRQEREVVISPFGLRAIDETPIATSQA